jgi:class 3 adenylate cyclase
VNIAYYALGDARVTTVYLSPPTSHLEAQWRIPALQAAFTMAAQDRTFVNIDPRGFGLSDRDIDDFSIDAMVSDVEAVVERLGGRPVGFYTLGFGSPIAVGYAARHPEATTHLVLTSNGISGPDFQIPRLTALLTALGPVDWKLASETAIRSFFPSLPEPILMDLAGMLRAATDPDQLLKFWDSAHRWDVDERATRVRARTLIIHDRSDTNADMRTTRRIASLIPDAQIAFVDGPFQGQLAAREFYETVLPATKEEPALVAGSSGTAIIVFTDIADSTALTERLGDAAFRTASRSLDENIRRAMREASGTPVDGKVLGDGVMGVFASAAQAIEAARRCVAASAEVELPLHLGIHAGDVIREDGNVYGGAVNIASRICGLCAPGEILVSATVRELARTSAGVTFEDRGEQTLKGIEDPVRVFAVRSHE